MRKSGYGAIWFYSSEIDPTDYTKNRIKTYARLSTENTFVHSNAAYLLIDIGSNLSAFKAWFSVTEPVEEDVVVGIDNIPIKVNATYQEDENLFDYAHCRPANVGMGDDVYVFEFDCVAGTNYFVMWNDDGQSITPSNTQGSWKEYDADGNEVVSANFYTIGTTQSIFNWKHKSTRCKVRLNPLTTQLRVKLYIATGKSIETLRDKVRMYVNSDGHTTRFRYPITMDGHPLPLNELRGKVIACFGDSITSFGSTNADGGYPMFLQKRLDNAIANYARGNATLADWADTDFTTYTTGEGTSHDNTVSSQIRWMLADGIVPDIVIINGGLNDIGKNNGYSWDIDAAVAAYPTTTAAVFQNPAMVICYALSVLRNLNPNVKVYIATTCKTLTASRATAVTNFAQKLRETAEAFGLEVIDFYRYAQQPIPATAADNPYYNDDTHPSQLGVDLMGRVVMGHLNSYVSP